jgi:predicted GNAT family N-acyltransferase
MTMTESPGFAVREIAWEDGRQALSAVRKAVFIDEQGVPEALEWDGLDARARHLLAEDADGNPIGTARLLDDGRIGRMAVLSSWRGRRVGQALLDGALRLARCQGMTLVYLDAQLTAIGFYQRSGFSAYGEVFPDAGIPHRRMERQLEE